jgi:hypothetical protein
MQKNANARLEPPTDYARPIFAEQTPLPCFQPCRPKFINVHLSRTYPDSPGHAKEERYGNHWMIYMHSSHSPIYKMLATICCVRSC